MRLRFRWLAGLVFVGLCWMPSPVHAQNIGHGEPTMWPRLPIPLRDTNQESGLYFAAEWLMLRTDNPLGKEVLALRGIKDFDGTILGTPGAFLGSGSVALKASDASTEKWSPGYRFTLGWRFENDMSIYANYMQMVTNRSVATASLLPGTFNIGAEFADSFLFVPFFNYSAFFAGPDSDVISQVSGAEVPAYGIFNGAEQVLIQLEQKMWSWEITGKFPVQLVEGCRTYCLVGPRFMYLEEHFKFRITDLALDGTLANQNVALYYNDWTNKFLGVQSGWGMEKYLGGGFGVSAEARVGLFANVRRGDNKLMRGDRGRHDTIEGYGFDDIGFSPMFQLSAYLEWIPVDGVQFRAGYEFMGVINTLRSSFPVDFNVGSLTPNYENKLWRLDGFNIGVALIF